MMTGTGPYGPVEMGGMFTTLKVRADQKRGDYSDPGDYLQPKGSQAYEYTGPPLATSRAPDAAGSAHPASHAASPSAPRTAPVVPAGQARKPQGHAHH
jgi:hypothetical protein